MGGEGWAVDLGSLGQELLDLQTSALALWVGSPCERVETSFSLSWCRGISLPWKVRALALSVVGGDMPKEVYVVSKFQRSSTGNCFLFFVFLLKRKQVFTMDGISQHASGNWTPRNSTKAARTQSLGSFLAHTSVSQRA